ncbi:MAG: 1-acyl-sn-glycerol-3-phosphate acyltransferase [Lachnospiraceae bacterium]|nr:1-acyl-sn-glycerol-3-phosphate acyltransferase [Lachnospiraceae bacterium]
MIRLIFVGGFVILFLIFSIPIMIAEKIIGKSNPERKSRSSLAIVNWAFRCVRFFAGTKVEYIGEENIPTDTAVLYAGNHRSFFDIVLTYPRVPRPTGYISKKEIEKVPLLNVWMRNLHCLFLDREDAKAGFQTLRDASDLLKNGISVCIFPEGTRNKEDGTLLPCHEGSFRIATKVGCPIIPMTITNSAAVFENQFPRIKKAHVIIEYGKRILYLRFDFLYLLCIQLDLDAKRKGIIRLLYNFTIENVHKIRRIMAQLNGKSFCRSV